MSKKFSFILVIGIILLYLIFFPHNIEKELIIIPSWAANINSVTATESEKFIPFKIDDSFGYCTPSGSVVFSEKTNRKVAMNRDFFVKFPDEKPSLELRDNMGQSISKIQSFDLPFFINDLFFTISSDRMFIKKYDSLGSEQFLVSPGSLITSIDAGNSKTAIGTLSGEFFLYDQSGEVIFRYFSTESRYSIVYSSAVNNDTSKISIITGLSPQKLIAFELEDNKYVKVFEKVIKKEYRRNVLLNYSDDGNFLYMENGNNLEVFTTDNYESYNIPLEGELKQVVFLGKNRLCYIITTLEAESRLVVLTSNKEKMAEFTYPSEDIYFYADDSCFYIGMDSKIIRYDIIEG